jgi:hypothetical protein
MNRTCTSEHQNIIKTKKSKNYILRIKYQNQKPEKQKQNKTNITSENFSRRWK